MGTIGRKRVTEGRGNWKTERRDSGMWQLENGENEQEEG